MVRCMNNYFNRGRPSCLSKFFKSSQRSTPIMSAARAIQRIQPHIPLIKFRFVKGALGAVPSVSTSKPTSNSSTLKVSTRRGEGIDFTHLPPRYRRLSVTPEEMDYINRGGPE